MRAERSAWQVVLRQQFMGLEGMLLSDSKEGSP